jgi:hypothetical protein
MKVAGSALLIINGITRRVVKENAVYIHNEVLFGHKNMDGTQEHC